MTIDQNSNQDTDVDEDEDKDDEPQDIEEAYQGLFKEFLKVCHDNKVLKEKCETLSNKNEQLAIDMKALKVTFVNLQNKNKELNDISIKFKSSNNMLNDVIKSGRANGDRAGLGFGNLISKFSLQNRRIMIHKYFVKKYFCWFYRVRGQKLTI